MFNDSVLCFEKPSGARPISLTMHQPRSLLVLSHLTPPFDDA
jgi:hypothetical protein